MMKLAIITSTRAEYGLLRPLILKLREDSYFQIQLIVTGTHLLEEYGKTVDYIKEDGIDIDYEIPIMDKGAHEPVKTIANALTAFHKLYEKEKYNGVILLGDRYELYGFAIPALLLRIPIIHIHGGERTEGAVDEQVRHSITKMAALHFPSAKEYANRIIQMGENPKYVHAVGALGIDNILNLVPMSRHKLEERLGIKLDSHDNFALVTFHPVTLDGEEQARIQAETVFKALKASELTCIVTMPNSDRGGQLAREVIVEYVKQDPSHFIYKKSLGQNAYLSLLNYVKLAVGNSSSGIIEVPSFHIPTINIGDRQKGRLSAESVIHCPCEEKAILAAIKKGLSDEFKVIAAQAENPYGDGKTAGRIHDILRQTNLKNEDIIKKRFYDIQCIEGEHK